MNELMDPALVKRLVSAQGSGDREAEGVAMRAVVRSFRGPFRQRGTKVRPLIERFYEKIAFGMSDCWYWCGAMHKLGYGLMNADGETKAHRVSWILHSGPIPAGLMVLHKCDVRCCVNPDHLFLGTQTDNMRDMMSKGRGKQTPMYGEQNAQSKLTAADVAEMKRIRAETGMPYWKLAQMFGVVTMTAQRACVGTSWRKP